MDAIPVCLTIAGSDSGGGAGIQTDLRTFNAFGTYGASAITAVTAQNPNAVTGIHAIPPEMVLAQVDAVCSAYPLGAIKTGMLFSKETIDAIAVRLAELNVPLVVDPVMVATSGARLLREDAIEVLCTRIIPNAAITTPNLPEAELILGRQISSLNQMIAAAQELAANGAATYLKGGHLAERPGADILAWDGSVYELCAPTLDCACTHGTGCTLSAALAAGLALGSTAFDAAVAAKAFVWQSLQGIRKLGEDVHGLYPPTTLDTSIVSVRRLDG